MLPYVFRGAAFAAARASAAHTRALSAGPPPPDWPQLMQAAITPSVAEELADKGYAVVDGALPPPTVAAAPLRSGDGLVRPNCTHLVRQGSPQPELLPKAHIYEAEITLDPRARAAAPLLASLDADRSLGVLLSLFLPRLRLDGHGIKAQYNAGAGGAFPIHTDSEEGIDGRAVTAIFYLNPDWAPGQGGELRLYPFPAAPPVDVAPLGGRLVLFSSTQMHHRVLPSAAPRYCFTSWLSQPRPRGPPPAPPRPPPPEPAAGQSLEDHAAEVRRFLLQPAVRRHVVKLVYGPEWERSLVDSHPACEATAAALAQHGDGAARAARALAPYSGEIARLAAACAAGGAAAAGLADARVRWF